MVFQLSSDIYHIDINMQLCLGATERLPCSPRNFPLLSLKAMSRVGGLGNRTYSINVPYDKKNVLKLFRRASRARSCEKIKASK